MRAGSIAWFARHELRLAWRDFVAIVTAGRRRRAILAAIGFAVFAVFMHVLAYFMVGPFADAGADPAAIRRDVLLYVTVIGLLAWALLVSQALEAVTRAFYARADLDLILTSPAPAPRIFAVRLGAIALAMMVTGMLIAGAFINVLAVLGGARWLAAYGVVAAGGAAATAIAVGLTVLLFRLIGPRRTRFVAQVLAAVIGAVFVIGLQGAAILSYGTISRFAILQSEKLAAILPPADSPLWWPARAMMGDVAALAAVGAACLVLLAAAVGLFATRFSGHAIAAAGAPELRFRNARRRRFRTRSAASVLRRKEWTLLLRDPWLMSQSLMQLLYLLPPALLLWLKVGEDGDAVVVIVPVLVVAAGQLAGGLAWLAVSGEDAPDLIATAPVAPGMVIRAKVEAVLGAIAAVSAPLLLLLALSAPLAALLTAVFIVAAAIEATAVQLLFRAQAKRSHFRRRQTSSRVATFAEAFSSMAWAATAGLAVAGSWLAVATAVVALAILGLARLARPQPAGARPAAPRRAGPERVVVGAPGIN